MNKQKEKEVAAKIEKIMNEGISGRRVSQRQAVAVAYSMVGKGRKKKK